jgi:DNA-binding SARP family transcriptional activator
MTNDTLWSLQLLEYWRLARKGEPVRVPRRQQRLISALALVGPRPRAALAGLLWPDSPESQAMTSLRVTLWHISHELPGVVCGDSRDTLSLSCDVSVDVRTIEQCAGGAAGAAPAPALLRELSRAELLPGWYDDWVVLEQERIRHLRLAALDTLARRGLTLGEPQTAASAALLAVSLEPLREASNLLLVASLLASGEHNAATRAFDLYRKRSLDVFGVEPDVTFGELLRTAPREPVFSS